jgi:hypothetical protein
MILRFVPGNTLLPLTLLCDPPLHSGSGIMGWGPAALR